MPHDAVSRPDDPSEPVTLGRADSAAGEVVIRQRTGPRSDGSVGQVEELIVNGAFAMDTVDVSSELRLAAVALAAGARTVLVGGLGLGVTAAALAEGGADRVDVVELAAPLVEWARSGLTPSLARAAAYPSVHLHVADVHDVLTGAVDLGRDRWDAIVLDVDNGPDFLIREPNADLYRPALLTGALDRILPGGLLLIWCQGRAPALAATLADLAGPRSVTEHLVDVDRDDRAITYALYALSKTGDARVGAVHHNGGHD